MSTFLLADIGGTHARFALLAGTRLQAVHSLDVGAHRTPEAAIGRFLEQHAGGVKVDGAVIAAAGPVSANRCKLTNGTWVLDGGELAAAFGFSAATIVNDLEALGWAVSQFRPDDWRAIGGGQPVVGAPVAVIAPGTGLGMACVIPGRVPRVLQSEGGHAALPVAEEREAAVATVLRKRHGHVSIERVLSGHGMENLHSALLEIDGVAAHAPGRSRSAPEISKAAFSGGDHHARHALDLFCSLLGSVAGDMALMFGARGGVYVGGGIVPGMVDYLAHSDFRRRFENKGRLATYVAQIPTRIIVRPDPAFLGLAALARSPHEHGDLPKHGT
jgi:glucokinase